MGIQRVYLVGLYHFEETRHSIECNTFIIANYRDIVKLANFAKLNFVIEVVAKLIDLTLLHNMHKHQRRQHKNRKDQNDNNNSYGIFFDMCFNLLFYHSFILTQMKTPLLWTLSQSTK